MRFANCWLCSECEQMNALTIGYCTHCKALERKPNPPPPSLPEPDNPTYNDLAEAQAKLDKDK